MKSFTIFFGVVVLAVAVAGESRLFWNLPGSRTTKKASTTTTTTTTTTSTTTPAPAIGELSSDIIEQVQEVVNKIDELKEREDEIFTNDNATNSNQDIFQVALTSLPAEYQTALQCLKTVVETHVGEWDFSMIVPCIPPAAASS